MISRFRAWDKKREEMVRNPSITFMREWLGDDKICCVDCMFENTKPWLIWMQSTGFRDNNDEEIYEGDILKIDGGGEITNGVVGWEYGCWVLEVPWVDHVKTPWPELKYYTSIAFEKTYIIGNIYQNPELMEV